MSERLEIGDIVMIPNYSSLFGYQNHDPVANYYVAKAKFKVVGADREICGSDDEGWFDNIYLVDCETGKDFPFMILNSQVKKVCKL